MGDEGTERSTLDIREAMAAEGKRLVDAARERGLTIRLLGGLAVRDHCEVLAFCSRDYSDLDVVARSADIVALVDFFAALGYREILHARQATGGSQAQFARPCEHRGPDGAPAHEDDHVDVFLDVFVMDHRIDLRDRLDLDPYTLSVGDVLLTKLQINESDVRDLRDIVTILKDRPVGDDEAPGVVNASYIAELCSADWGMHHDVVGNLQAVGELLPRLGLGADEEARVELSRQRLLDALEQAPKSRRWRWRARAGTRRPWHNEVEERDGQYGTG